MAKFSFFSLEWLTGGERRKQKEEMALKEKELNIKEKTIELQSIAMQSRNMGEKPYKSCRKVGNSIIVGLNDGTVLATDEDVLKQIRDAQTEEEVIKLFVVQHQKEMENVPLFTKEEISILKESVGIFKGNMDFVVKGKQVFLKGVGLEIPPIVLASFIEILEKKEALEVKYPLLKEGEEVEEIEQLSEYYEALKMFWAWAALNPIENSRNDLLRFINKNDITITRNGLLVCYRRVVSVKKEGDNKELIAFISNEYNKVKRWKKSPKNYWVWQTDDGKLELRGMDGTNGIETNHGNLEELYLKMPDMQEKSYTDGHTRKKDIRVGSIYREDEKKINLDSSVSCGAGI